VFTIVVLAFCLPSVLGHATSLHGQVTDQNGAVVIGAKVTIRSTSGAAKTANTDNDGSYTFTGLPPGEYTIEASAPSLILQEPLKITLRTGGQTLDLQLGVFIPEQKITIEENNRAAVSTDANSNASAHVLRGEDLDALGDSPEDLQEALLALAGPSAGPSGGQIFIDGFSGGQLPSKNSIREIRINQNPFSPEYDRLGFSRIEILTKPGSGTLESINNP
jgi:carboxypeptidase family protein